LQALASYIWSEDGISKVAKPVLDSVQLTVEVHDGCTASAWIMHHPPGLDIAARLWLGVEETVYKGLAWMGAKAQGGFEGIHQGPLRDDEDHCLEYDQHDEQQYNGLCRQA
jgi:hypothetical protein